MIKEPAAYQYRTPEGRIVAYEGRLYIETEGMVMVPVPLHHLAPPGEWSEPVQLRLELVGDGQYMVEVRGPNDITPP